MIKKLGISFKMLIYAILMPALVITQFCLDNRAGLPNVIFYLTGVLQILLCRYISKALDEEIRKGVHLEMSKMSFDLLTVIFVVDFIANIVFMIPFPVRHTLLMYYFFMGITVLELVVSSFGILLYIPESRTGVLWIVINLFVIFEIIMAISGHESSRTVFVIALLFLIRFITKCYAIIRFNSVDKKGYKTLRA